MAGNAGNIKVTVCFDTISLLIPCRNEDMLVGDLIELAIARYKKAIGKPVDYRVTVNSLRSHGGGILDPDDKLSDVVDDREQIVAIYEEQDSRKVWINRGDGNSASSAGTSSPEMFFQNNYAPCLKNEELCDTLITDRDVTRMVRQASEPALVKPNSAHATFDKFDDLTQDDTILSMKKFERRQMPGSHFDANNLNQFKRSLSRKSLCKSEAMLAWLEAQEDRLAEKQSFGKYGNHRSDPIGCSDQGELNERCTLQEHDWPPSALPSGTYNYCLSSIIVLENSDGPLGIHVIEDFDEEGRSIGLVIQSIVPDGRVGRDGRLHEGDRIVEINGTSLIDTEFSSAQEIFKQALQSNETKLRVVFAKPQPVVRQSAFSKPKPDLPSDNKSGGPSTSTPSKDLLEFPNQSVLHTPMSTYKGRLPPYSSVERGSEIKANQSSTYKIASSSNFRTAPSTAFKTIPSSTTKPAPSSVSKQAPGTATKEAPYSVSKQALLTGSRQNLASERKRTQSSSNYTTQICLDSVTTQRGSSSPPPLPAKSTASSVSASKSRFVPLMPSSRSVGKLIQVQLIKDQNGLGFSITTRDNPLLGTSCPIYIKHILSQGAAVVDGRLQPGDRLIEVNGIDLSSISQDEVVTYLRGIKLGGVVNLLVSRNSPDMKTTSQPNDNMNYNDENDNLIDRNQSDVFLFIINVKDKGANLDLGISVRGKTKTCEMGKNDLGLFIKDIQDSGAAAKDGRLRLDDRLIEVNGEQLFNLMNNEAMEVLQEALQREGPESGTICIVVERSKSGKTTKTSERQSSVVKLSHTTPCRSTPSHNENPSTQPKFLVPSSANSPISRKQFAASKAGETGLAERESNSQNLAGSQWSLASSIRNSCRNISYHKATHASTFGESLLNDLTAIEYSSDGKNSDSGTESNYIETEIVEDDDDATPKPVPIDKRHRAPQNDEYNPTPPDWKPINNPDVTFMSSNASSPPDIDPLKAFARDGLGRQSMSEKRKGHLDPKTCSFYQQIKVAQAQNETQGTLKKAMSVESLLSQSNLATPKIDSRMCGMRETMKRYTSVENLKVARKLGANVCPTKSSTDQIKKQTIEEGEEQQIPVDGKKKMKDIFKNLFKLGKSKKDEKKIDMKNSKPAQNSSSQSSKKNDEITREPSEERVENGRQRTYSVGYSKSDANEFAWNGQSAKKIQGGRQKCHKMLADIGNQMDDQEEFRYTQPCHSTQQPSISGAYLGGYQMDERFNRTESQHCYGECCNPVPPHHLRELYPEQPYQRYSVPHPYPYYPDQPTPAASYHGYHHAGFGSNHPNEPRDRHSQCLGYGMGPSNVPSGMMMHTPHHYPPEGMSSPPSHRQPRTPMRSTQKMMPPPSDMYMESQYYSKRYAVDPMLQHRHDTYYTGPIQRKYGNAPCNSAGTNIHQF